MMNYKYTISQSSRRHSQEAFTLIELLVVVALTIILLTLIFAPLIQAFSFTQQAQATAQAQDAARSSTEQLSRELASAAGIRDTSNNFLDLPLLNKSGGFVIAHAYNAYLDIIPPRVSQGTIIDPTIDRNSPTVGPGSASLSGLTPELSGTGVTLPLAAGSTVIRWFPGLRYPIDPRYAPTVVSNAINDNGTAAYEVSQPYTNRYEHMSVSSGDSHYNSYTVHQGLNNTYQLYRANFQPFVPYADGMLWNTSTKPTVGTYVPNTNLLPTTANGLIPIYDDPDFFRIVAVGDTDYVAGQGDSGVYTASTAEAHNFRVYNWVKIAKEVISTRDVDLVGLTRTGNKIVYDMYGNPVNSYDNSSGTLTPIVRTTVNFAPGLISDDPMAATNTSNSAQEYGAVPPSLQNELPYVPTEFASEFGNWQGTPAVTISKSTSTGQLYLQTGLDPSATGDTLASPNYSSSQTTVNSGDLVLAQLTNSGSLGTPVYDVTAGAPISISGSTNPYDAMILDENSGVVSFSVPALPPLLLTQSTQSVPPNTYWYYKSNSSNQINLVNNIDTSLYSSSPAPESPLAVVPNAQIVVNSERVIGPDQSVVLGTTPSTDFVQYTRVNVSPSGNEYSIDYQTQTITVPQAGVDYQIAYNYQNNIGTGNVVDTVRASYYTASMIRLNIGIRVYGPTSGVSEYFSLNSQVGVSNAKAN